MRCQTVIYRDIATDLYKQALSAHTRLRLCRGLDY